jgi:hypothetical protein
MGRRNAPAEPSFIVRVRNMMATDNPLLGMDNVLLNQRSNRPHHPPIDAQALPRDVRRRVRREEGDGGGDLFARAAASSS